MKKIAVIAAALLSLCLSWAQPQSGPISMVFSDTDASLVFKTISMRTGANIVYAAKEKAPVTINLNVRTAEEAIRGASAAAGLIYRKVNDVFVVAPPGQMRQALEPYGFTVTYTLPKGHAEKVAPKLQDALPYATVRTLGDKIVMTAVLEDIRQANDLVKEASDSIASEKSASELVVLRNITAAQIGPLLKGLYPALTVTVNETTDTSAKPRVEAIGISGSEPLVREAQATIEKLDIANVGDGSNQLVFRVYDLKYTSGPIAKSFLEKAAPEVEVIVGPEAYSPRKAQFNPLAAMLGGGGQGGGGFFGGGGGVGGQTGGLGGGQTGGLGVGGQGQTTAKEGDKAKTVILKGRQSDVNTALRLLAEVDLKPQQVMVEVQVVETSPSFSENLGVSYNWAPFDFHELAPGTGYTDNPAGGPWTNNVITKPVGMGIFSRTPWNFRATIDAMVQKREARVLAKPSVQVIDNNEAFVFIGDTIRARVITQGALGAQNVEIQEFPVGIILLISPRLNADGNITMNVNPVVSSVTAIGEDNIPQTSAREAQTTVIVRDGETIVLGGLIRDEESKIVSEIPFLSKLPIVGELFKHRSKSRRRTDIIVSITPHILKDSS